MIRHEFEHGSEPEVLVTVGVACEDGEHERCAGVTIVEGEPPWLCVCSCHLKEKQKEIFDGQI